MKPYDVICASDTGKHYIVGWVGEESTGPWSMGSILITSIKASVVLKKTEYINSSERREIEEHLKQQGAAFLNPKEIDIVVKFSNRGLYLYRHRLLHLRPPCVKPDSNDDHILHFNCTEFHARAYFFKFGKDAVIIEPKSLAEEFQRDFFAAWQAYEYSSY